MLIITLILFFYGIHVVIQLIVRITKSISLKENINSKYEEHRAVMIQLIQIRVLAEDADIQEETSKSRPRHRFSSMSEVLEQGTKAANTDQQVAEVPQIFDFIPELRTTQQASNMESLLLVAAAEDMKMTKKKSKDILEMTTAAVELQHRLKQEAEAVIYVR